MSKPTTIGTLDLHAYVLEYTDENGVLTWSTTSSGAFMLWPHRAVARRCCDELNSFHKEKKYTVRHITGEFKISKA